MTKAKIAVATSVGLDRQKHRRSDSTYVDPILRVARLRRSDYTYVDLILRGAQLHRSDSTYVDPMLHARIGIARIQNRTRGAKNKVNSEQ